MAGVSDSAEDLKKRFREYYAVAEAPVVRELERRVLGENFGGTSYTDVDQARRLGELLGLEPGVELLDLGSGSGWPGLFLARETGCRAMLTDLPFAGLWTAQARASDDSINARIVAASATELPFSDDAFDAISHTDVLC